MKYAVILAGGVGSRMNMGNIPKQYMMVNDRPIISYCMEIFQKHSMIDKIIIVVADEWKDFVEKWVTKEKITKVVAYAKSGASRQNSIYNALKVMEDIADYDDIVLVHDAARPCVSDEIITGCIEGTFEADGVMPVLTVKDTIYVSNDGGKIDDLLNRDTLYAGQAPEAFKYGKYYDIHKNMTIEEIDNIRGSSEIAYKGGMDIKLISGSEANIKITTAEDFKKFNLMLEEKGEI